MLSPSNHQSISDQTVCNHQLLSTASTIMRASATTAAAPPRRTTTIMTGWHNKGRPSGIIVPRAPPLEVGSGAPKTVWAAKRFQGVYIDRVPRPRLAACTATRRGLESCQSRPWGLHEFTPPAHGWPPGGVRVCHGQFPKWGVRGRKFVMVTNQLMIHH